MNLLLLVALAVGAFFLLKNKATAKPAPPATTADTVSNTLGNLLKTMGIGTGSIPVNVLNYSLPQGNSNSSNTAAISAAAAAGAGSLFSSLGKIFGNSSPAANNSQAGDALQAAQDFNALDSTYGVNWNQDLYSTPAIDNNAGSVWDFGNGGWLDTSSDPWGTLSWN